MLILTLPDTGARELEIPDAGAELRTYRLTPAPAGLDLLAFTLERADTKALYHLVLSVHGFWRCTCDAWKYRKIAAEGCKHTRALLALADFAKLFEVKP